MRRAGGCPPGGPNLTEYGWRMLVEHGAETPVLTDQEIPGLPAMAERCATEAAAMRDYLAALTDEGLAAPLRYAFLAAEASELRPGGETIITRLADILVVQAIRSWITTDSGAQSGPTRSAGGRPPPRPGRRTPAITTR